jgi:hypothetical protein
MVPFLRKGSMPKIWTVSNFPHPPLQNADVVPQTVKSVMTNAYGLSVYYLVTPKVVQAMKDHFGCPTAVGAGAFVWCGGE